MDKKFPVMDAFEVAEFQDNGLAEELLNWEMFPGIDDCAGGALRQETNLSGYCLFP